MMDSFVLCLSVHFWRGGGHCERVGAGDGEGDGAMSGTDMGRKRLWCYFLRGSACRG